MTPSDAVAVYWDASVFLAYVNDVADRAPVVGTLLDRSRSGHLDIFTSVLSMTEVAFAGHEQSSRTLDPGVEGRLSRLFRTRQIVRTVDFSQAIAVDARRLMRRAVGERLSLKPADAIHLATAARSAVGEVHTYDRKWSSYGGIVGLPIREPVTNAPRMF